MTVQSAGLVHALPLFGRARAREVGPVPDLLLWEGRDERVRAVAEAVAATGVARPAMLAHHDPEPGWGALEADRVRARWVEEGNARAAPASDAELGAAAVALGLVGVSVGGADTSTPEVLRAGLRYVGARRTVSIAFFVGLRHGPRAGELFLIADIGVVPSPSEDELLDIAVESVDTWELATGEPARVAFLGISTKSDPTQVHAVRGALERLRAERPAVVADGELQADAAVSAAVAARKDPAGEIAGSANVLIVPTLEGGNISYKLLQRLGGAEVFGVTQGYRHPFHDVSRGCDEHELLDTALYCAARARLAEAP